MARGDAPFAMMDCQGGEQRMLLFVRTNVCVCRTLLVHRRPWACSSCCMAHRTSRCWLCRPAAVREQAGVPELCCRLLRVLSVQACDEGVVDEDGFVVPVSLPDVWVQLLERCEAADQASQPAVDSSMARLQLQEGP